MESWARRKIGVCVGGLGRRRKEEEGGGRRRKEEEGGGRKGEEEEEGRGKRRGHLEGGFSIAVVVEDLLRRLHTKSAFSLIIPQRRGTSRSEEAHPTAKRHIPQRRGESHNEEASPTAKRQVPQRGGTSRQRLKEQEESGGCECGAARTWKGRLAMSWHT
eukprot:3941866-Rhodomonas_salina.2